MFGMKSKGLRNFEGCQNRTRVTSEPFALVYGISGNSFGGWFQATLNPDTSYPRVTTVECQQLGVVERNLNGTVEGVKGQIAEVIGKESCRNCMFASMNPLEAQRAATEIAEEKRNQAELQVAWKIAQSELNAYDDFFNGGPVPPRRTELQ